MTTVRIGTEDFEVQDHYEREGLDLPPMEQAALDFVFHQMLQKIFGRLVKAQKDAGILDKPGMQEIISAFAKDYSFGDRSKKVLQEATKRAKDHIKEQIKLDGYKLSQVTTENLNELTADLVESAPIWKANAEEMVDPLLRLDPMPMTAEELEEGDNQ